MILDEYITHMKSNSHLDADLSVLMAPFGLGGGLAEISDLPVGMVLDGLLLDFNLHDEIDFVDVLTIAWEVGLDWAGCYLDHPDKIFQVF